MAFLDKINQVATTIETKTNDTIEITKLNSKIRTENTAAIEELIKIGEIYYKQYAATGEIAPEALPFCQAAKGHYDAIAEAQAEIERVKKEGEAARAAAAAAAASSAAAAAAPAAEPIGIGCPNCGTVNKLGTSFCRECGTKLTAEASAETPEKAPEKRTCPACGAEVPDDAAFCIMCGQKL